MASAASPRWLRVSLALAVLFGCGLATAFQAGIVRTRVAAVLAPCGLALTIRVLRSTIERRALRLFALLSAIALGVLGFAALTDLDTAFFKMAGLVVYMACGWLVFLPLWSAPYGARQKESGPTTLRRWAIPALGLMAGMIGLVVRAGRLGRFGFILDENLYLFQASHVLNEFRGLRLGALFVPFLIERQMFYRGGFLNGQYPPGWPAFLAVLRPLGLQSFVGPLLLVVCVVSVVVLGRRLVSQRMGMVAGVLTTINWRFVSVGATYFPHAFCAALAILACYCLAPAQGDGRLRRTGLEVIAGLLIGGIVLTRPLTGVALGAALLLWRWLRKDESLEAGLKTTVRVAAGALVPILWLLDYNLATTGGALRFGYDPAHDGLQSLGFGPRGQIAYGEPGLPVRVAAEFGVRVALSNLASTVTQSMVQFWPCMFVLPLIVASVVQRIKVPWWRAAPFSLPVLAHALYFYPDTRFHAELLPFGMLATAYLITELLGRNARTVPSVVLAVALTAANGAAGFVRQRHIDASRLQYFEQVEHAKARYGHVLAFVKDDDDPDLEQQGLAMLYWYNSQGFPGEIVVARDIGSKKRLLMDCFPDYQPIIVTAAHDEYGFWSPPRVTLLAPAVNAPTPSPACLLEDGKPGLAGE